MSTNDPEWDPEAETWRYPPAADSTVGVNGRGARRTGKSTTGGLLGARTATSGADVTNQASQTTK